MITNKLKKDLNGISNIDSFQESIEGYGAYINKSGFEIIKIKGLAGDRINLKNKKIHHIILLIYQKIFHTLLVSIIMKLLKFFVSPHQIP